MKLIKNPKRIWRHFSTWAMTTAGGLQAVWLAIPQSMRDDLPKRAGEVVAWITLLIAVWGIGGKVVDQTPKEPPEPKP
jgi:hypothetical protein